MTVKILGLRRPGEAICCPRRMTWYMKPFAVFMMVFFMQLHAFSYAQSISLDVKNASLRSVITALRAQSGYDFMVGSEVLNAARPVTVSLRNVSFAAALEACFKGQELTYAIVDGSVVIKPKTPAKNAAAALIDVKGKVTNSKGAPVPGVVIRVNGSNKNAVTDEQGHFTLSGVNENAVLLFSMMGFAPLTVDLKGRKDLSIQLTEADTKLNEVVVVGYGTVLKKDLTGSVGQVDPADMAKAPVATFDQALAGRVAGVNVSSGDGQPGSTSNIVIRGGNSLTQSTAPLYVIDGFPVENYETLPVSPEEIATFTVLKDASATAIYGARGANGVIVITTKKGRIGKPVVDYKGSVGIQQVTNTMEMLSPYEFVKYQLELTPAKAQETYLDKHNLTLDDYRNKQGINWQDELLRTAPMHMHNIAVRGGSGGTRYSISGSLYDQEGVVINSNYKRYTGRITLDQDISKKIKTGVNVSLGQTITTGYPIAQGGASMLGYVMYNAWAYRPVTGGDESMLDQFVDDDPQNTGAFLRINPVINAKEEFYRNMFTDISVNSYLSYEILKGLTLKVTGGLVNRKTQNQYFYNSKTSRGTPLMPNNFRGSYGGISNGNNRSWLNENTLSYQRKFNTRHSIDLLGGFTVQKSYTDRYAFESQQVPNEELGVAALLSGTPYSNSSMQSVNTMASFFGRANYGYDSRYLFTFTMRADGSSKFPGTNKWGYFPSGAVAWRVKGENFLKDNPTISEAKLRVSYGITGNNRVGDFAYFPGLVLNDQYGYSYGDAQPTKGLIYGSMGNSLLKWENTGQLDAGLELGLFKDRVTIEADVYRKTTTDLLLNASVPRTTGFISVFENIGSIRNQGLELTLTTVNVRKKDISWQSSFNISFNSNKILGLVSGENNLRTAVTWDNFYQTPLFMARVGQPAALFYGYIWDGNYQYEDFDEVAPGRYLLKGNVHTNESTRPAVPTVQPGDIKYRDMNGDGVITSADQGIIGNPLPKHTGGFANNVTYKGLSLHMLLQWSYGNDVYNANRMAFEGNSLGRPALNQYVSYAGRWTPENQNNELYRTGGHGPFGYYSSRVVEDGSFLRLKTVSLAYRVPAIWSKKAHMSSLSFNLSAQNLLVWTKYKGMDPEVSVRHTALTPGFDFSAYPRARTVVFGINATF